MYFTENVIYVPLGVVQKQMKTPMNGFVLHVNNNLENQFPTKKNSLDSGRAIFLQESIL